MREETLLAGFEVELLDCGLEKGLLEDVLENGLPEDPVLENGLLEEDDEEVGSGDLTPKREEPMSAMGAGIGDGAGALCFADA